MDVDVDITDDPVLLRQLLLEERQRSETERYRADELERKLEEQLRIHSPSRVAALKGHIGIGPTGIARPKMEILESPSGAKRKLLETSYVALVTRTAWLHTQMDIPETIFEAFATVVDAGGRDARLMAGEGNYKTLAALYLPTFVELFANPGGETDALAAFGHKGLITTAWKLNPLARGDLALRPALSDDRPFRPVFSCEMKSVGNTWMEQDVYYVLAGMISTFFPAKNQGTIAGQQAFFKKPPVGFTLLCFAHLGYLCAIEWVGKAVVSAVSNPFFLGSPAHEAAVKNLPDVHYQPPEDPPAGNISWQHYSDDFSTAWSIHDGIFRKTIRGDARTGEQFVEMTRVYTKLAELPSNAPSAIVRGARLLFGMHELMVVMPAAEGSECMDEEVTSEGPIMRAVAKSIAWLAARSRIVYVDLRGPNVIKNETAVWLVDYDDCFVTDSSVETLDSFKAKVGESIKPDQPFVGRTFANDFIAGRFPHLERALEEEFRLLH